MFGEEAGNAALEHSVTLSRQLFAMMGIEAEVVNASGLAYAEMEESILREAEVRLDELIRRWYGS